MTDLIFVHGLANGPAERRAIGGRMLPKIPRDLLEADIFAVAAWRSRGSWSMDLTDLGHPDGIRAEEAIDDVYQVLCHALFDFDGSAAGPAVVIGHSMGAVLARLALGRVTAHIRDRVALVTVGSPLGNPVLWRALFAQPWSHPCAQPCPVKWYDVWNREDPISADILLGHVAPLRVDHSVQVSAPGTPSPANPLAEHSAYFDLPEFWAVVEAAARGLK